MIKEMESINAFFADDWYIYDLTIEQRSNTSRNMSLPRADGKLCTNNDILSQPKLTEARIGANTFHPMTFNGDSSAFRATVVKRSKLVQIEAIDSWQSLLKMTKES